MPRAPRDAGSVIPATAALDEDDPHAIDRMANEGAPYPERPRQPAPRLPASPEMHRRVSRGQVTRAFSIIHNGATMRFRAGGIIVAHRELYQAINAGSVRQQVEWDEAGEI